MVGRLRGSGFEVIDGVLFEGSGTVWPGSNTMIKSNEQTFQILLIAGVANLATGYFMRNYEYQGWGMYSLIGSALTILNGSMAADSVFKRVE